MIEECRRNSLVKIAVDKLCDVLGEIVLGETQFVRGNKRNGLVEYLADDFKGFLMGFGTRQVYCPTKRPGAEAQL